MKRNDIEIYNISKQIKRLQKKVENSNIAILTMIVGFLGNVVSIVLGLLKDKINDILFITANIIVIVIIVIAVILFVIIMIGKKTKTVVEHSQYEWCTRFDEYVVPNTKCALEVKEILECLKIKGKKNSPQYKLYMSELVYYLSSAARALKEIVNRCISIIGTWIAQERVETIINLIEDISKIVDKNSYPNIFIDIAECKNSMKVKY